jgi:putative membrane protein
MANERTFLAWIRTALALSAAGVALEALELPIAPGLRLTSALVLIALGLVSPLLSWWGWARTERALRLRRPLPSAPLGPVLAVGTTVAAALVLVGLALE